MYKYKIDAKLLISPLERITKREVISSSPYQNMADE